MFIHKFPVDFRIRVREIRSPAFDRWRRIRPTTHEWQYRMRVSDARQLMTTRVSMNPPGYFKSEKSKLQSLLQITLKEFLRERERTTHER